MSATWTEKQGQYLAFIHYYSKINGRTPAESDLEKYFKVAAPIIHQMVLKLEEKGLISRVLGQARSIKILAPAEDIPALN